MFYNKYYESNFEELITYYPRFYIDVLEMNAVLEAEGGLADGLESGIERVFSDCFIDTADEQTINKLEKFLNIRTNKERSLEERRKIVKSMFVGSGKISAETISEVISTYTGTEVTCRFEPFDLAGNNRLYIDFYRGDESVIYMDDILYFLELRIPAHIEYRAAVNYSYTAVVHEPEQHDYQYDYLLCGTRFAG